MVDTFEECKVFYNGLMALKVCRHVLLVKHVAIDRAVVISCTVCLRWCLVNIENMIPASGRPKKEAAQGTALQQTRGERPSQKQSRINTRKLWKQSQTRQGSPEPAPVVNNLPQHATELSFSIKRALGARWDLTSSKNTTRPNILNWCPDWNSYL